MIRNLEKVPTYFEDYGSNLVWNLRVDGGFI